MGLEEDVAALLKAKRLTISVAEAGTEGLLAYLLTSVPGSSAYFIGGVLPYARSLKVGVLGMSAATLEAHGSVHETTALDMARRVREVCGTDIGVSTTGIAGPGGGSPQRPVGLFCIAVSCRDGRERSQEHRFGLVERNANREAAARAALALLKEHLAAEPVKKR
ncbi:MAG: nicotinamide-nucleotide amidohydrolase family protein [Chloroflexi bacterium]|nr:nicotinamide-nucleotide amidohydrolase family protein [Chloroflexota bacterium]